MTHDELAAKVEALTARVDELEQRNRYLDAVAEEDRPKGSIISDEDAHLLGVSFDEVASRATRNEVVAQVGSQMRPILRALPASTLAKIIAEGEPADLMESVFNIGEAKRPSAPNDVKAMRFFFALARRHAVTWADIGVAADGTVSP